MLGHISYFQGVIETAQTTLNMAKKLSKQNRTKDLHLTKPVTAPARETQAFLRSTPLTLEILGCHTLFLSAISKTKT